MTTTWTTKQTDFPHLTATSQDEIISADWAEALMMDYAKGMVTVTVTESGLRVTQAMVWAEIRQTRASQTRPAQIPAMAYHQFSSPSFRW
jgi:hypothetical protein